MCVCVCVRVLMSVCVCVCVNVFLSCEITSKTKMIMVTEAWVRSETDLTMFLHVSLLKNGNNRYHSYKSD